MVIGTVPGVIGSELRAEGHTWGDTRFGDLETQHTPRDTRTCAWGHEQGHWDRAQRHLRTRGHSHTAGHSEVSVTPSSPLQPQHGTPNPVAPGPLLGASRSPPTPQGPWVAGPPFPKSWGMQDPM